MTHDNIKMYTLLQNEKKIAKKYIHIYLCVVKLLRLTNISDIHEPLIGIPGNPQ